MGKIFTADTTDTINVAMSIAADCFDDRYTAEVQSAEVKVWNELTRMNLLECFAQSKLL